VTRGQLPQRAGSLGLNGGGTAAAVPPINKAYCLWELSDELIETSNYEQVTGSINIHVF